MTATAAISSKHRSLRCPRVFVAKSPWSASSSDLARAGSKSSNGTSMPTQRSTRRCTTSTSVSFLLTRSTNMDSHDRRNCCLRQVQQRDSRCHRTNSLPFIRAEPSDRVDGTQRLPNGAQQTITTAPSQSTYCRAELSLRPQPCSCRLQVGRLTL